MLSRISRNPHWLIASLLIPFQVLRMAFLLHFVTMPLEETSGAARVRREKAARMTCKIERLASKGNMIVLRLCDDSGGTTLKQSRTARTGTGK